jgi:hypothetical protein
MASRGAFGFLKRSFRFGCYFLEGGGGGPQMPAVETEVVAPAGRRYSLTKTQSRLNSPGLVYPIRFAQVGQFDAFVTEFTPTHAACPREKSRDVTSARESESMRHNSYPTTLLLRSGDLG